jgi:hypothetical protein
MTIAWALSWNLWTLYEAISSDAVHRCLCLPVHTSRDPTIEDALFIPTTHLGNQSDAQISDHKQISMDFLDSEENLGLVTKTIPISTPRSKT